MTVLSASKPGPQPLATAMILRVVLIGSLVLHTAPVAADNPQAFPAEALLTLCEQQKATRDALPPACLAYYRGLLAGLHAGRVSATADLERYFELSLSARQRTAVIRAPICLPPGLSLEQLAEDATQEIAVVRRLRESAAHAAVLTSLARKYPCKTAELLRR